MTKLLHAPLIGRLGNLMFIYAKARAFCEQNGYEFCSEPWIGERIFNIPLAVRPGGRKPDLVWPEATHQNQDSLIYTRKQVREWFQWRPEILERLKVGVDCSHPVVLNVREASDCPIRISRECYIESAISTVGCRSGDYIFETDLHPTRLDGFDGDPQAAGLGTTMVAVPSFYRLTKAKVLFRAVSTFSWWAATLSDARVFSPYVQLMVPGSQWTYFLEGNYPVMSPVEPNTDLRLRDE